MPGTLFVVATPIGNLDDITLRALRVLREAALIAAEDTRRTAHLLARHGITTPTTSLHEHNEEKKSAALVARMTAGDSVALVSDAGTPTISDPGARLVQRAIAAGVRVEPIPGPSAAIAALAASGLPTESFTFMGFPPTRSKDRQKWFERLCAAGGTVVFYEAPHRIKTTIGELTKYIPGRPACIGRELTKAHEELVRGPINEVLGRLSSDRGEFTVVVDVGKARQDTVDLSLTAEILSTSRRAVVADVAQRLGVQANDLYEAVERLKNRS